MVDERSADDHRDREAPDVEVDNNGAVELSSETAPPRPWWSLAGTYVWKYGRYSTMLAVALVAAGLVSVVTIDLGPSLRSQAEDGLAQQIDRPVSIGRIGAYVFPGRFLVEDIVIGGQNSGDRPFFVADRIVVTTDWLPLLNGEVFLDTVDIQGWRMLVERFEGGGQTFPRFVNRRDENSQDAVEDEAEISRPAEDVRRTSFVTTVQYLRAHEGEFVYEDHGAPWSIVARNVDLTMTKGAGYGGHASFDGGTVQIKDFEPMTATWESMYVKTLKERILACEGKAGVLASLT